mgnify:FL=1
MVIAVTYDNEFIFPHFGRSPYLAIYLIGENKQIVRKSIVSLEGSGHMGIALILHDLDVDVLICGGIGLGAVNTLKEIGIEVYPGNEGNADEIVTKFLNGLLLKNDNPTCSCHEHHDHDHECSDGEGHSCDCHDHECSDSEEHSCGCHH